jgi:o-succinylbenzoate synthase
MQEGKGGLVLTLTGVELRRIAMPLVAPFRTTLGVITTRDVLLVRAVLDGPSGESQGWGECAAPPDPLWSDEYLDGAADVLTRFLVPRLFAAGPLDGPLVGPLLTPFKGNRLAKAAIETAVLDAELRAAGRSFARELGATRDRVPCGVTVGLHDSAGPLLDEVAGHLGAGYARVELKIGPGWDLEPVRAVRARFGDDLPLAVDADGAYTLSDAAHLARLDEFGLQWLGQPLPADDLLGHAELAKRISTPVCLDESITSARAAAMAVTLGACSVISVSAGRVGGYLEARRVQEVCRAHGIAAWCGGMQATGVGRAANVALAALPGFTQAGETSPTERFSKCDVTEPFELVDGHLEVPAGPGLGVTPNPGELAAVTTGTDWVPHLS